MLDTEVTGSQWTRQSPGSSRPELLCAAEMRTGAVLLVLLLLGVSVEEVHKRPLTRPQRELAQHHGDEDDEGEDVGVNGYDDDDEEEEEEAVMTGPGDRAQLRCYFCKTVHKEEPCTELQSCGPSQPSCEMVITQSETESRSLATYSGWCADTCQPIIRTFVGTRLTVSCCNTALCNRPPWQTPGPQDSLEDEVRRQPGSEARGQPESKERGRPGSTSGKRPGSTTRGRLDSIAKGQPGSRARGSQGSAPTVGTALLLSLLAGRPAVGS
ncbi:PREDICTED: glycosylphosphatidylinositol-anchored high density lipoprotein-binding protein 1 [Elephantulus edwardii]|uniref:glycosylphosphatidylinositol-anchored high density lipoprotein-binding protein 1 n=1 Tax=Elephantulus edwardii TaxID=28737 RepID=UPI0003F0D143|nr:PREDICTED: glycosylphosphatidylinositol-anchored high density lipoprotein-binding protein 1 [Elephantulus edwardii]